MKRTVSRNARLGEGPDAYSFGPSPLVGGDLSHQATGWVLRFSESELGARLVLLALSYRMNNETGICFPSLDTIARECRMTKKGVIYAIERLEESGELEVIREEKPGRKRVNRYRMPVFAAWWAEAELIPQKRKKGYQGIPLENQETVTSIPERVTPIPEKGYQGIPESEVESKIEQKEESSSLPLCKEERRALPKPVKEPKVRKGFQKTFAKREYVPPPKPPETWNWFAKLWKRYVDVFPVGRPEHWEILDKLYSEFSATGLEDRLSRWLDQRDHKTNAWSALEFLNECPLMDEKGEDDIPTIVNEE